MTGAYHDIREIETVVENFESCRYRTKDFTHARHLTVAAWYLTHLSFEEALDRMRQNLLRFTRHHNVQCYHETITRFWLQLADDFLRCCEPGLPLTTKVNRLIAGCGDKEILFGFYSRERVMSDAARADWVEPDLKPIDASAAGLRPASRQPAARPAE